MLSVYITFTLFFFFSCGQVELKTMWERAVSFEEELGETKGQLDRIRRDLAGSKEACHAALQDGQACRQQAQKLARELDTARDQEKMLSDQVRRLTQTGKNVLVFFVRGRI